MCRFYLVRMWAFLCTLFHFLSFIFIEVKRQRWAITPFISQWKCFCFTFVLSIYILPRNWNIKKNRAESTHYRLHRTRNTAYMTATTTTTRSNLKRWRTFLYCSFFAQFFFCVFSWMCWMLFSISVTMLLLVQIHFHMCITKEKWNRIVAQIFILKMNYYRIGRV